jgi:hypothetical protein
MGAEPDLGASHQTGWAPLLTDPGADVNARISPAWHHVGET